MAQPKKWTKKQLDYIHTHYTYDPETGDVYNSKGNKAQCKNSHGYYVTGTPQIGHLRVHRIAWELYYGSEPTMTIDHINGIKTDNRIVNLQDVSFAMNTSLRFGRNKDTGCVGISYLKDSKRKRPFCVRYQGKSHYFATLAEAIRFRQERGLRL